MSDGKPDRQKDETKYQYLFIEGILINDGMRTATNTNVTFKIMACFVTYLT